MKKRLFAILTALALCLSLMPTAALAATAATDVTYRDASGASKTCASATVVESGDTTWGDDGNNGWYVVNSNVDISSRVTVMGNVHLILTDGCTLTVNGGIQVTGGKALGGDSLTIYGQENGTGKLIATGTSYGDAGIGGDFDLSGGTVTIHGGTVEATGGSSAAGIGGGYNGDGGTVTIHGGKVTATGGYGGAGIGGGYNGDGGTVTITGGKVTATGGYGGAGIGGGYGGDGGTITINGGTVNATGGSDGAGIGGGSRNLSGGSGGTITINGGTVTATGGSGEGAGAGIGGGRRGDGGTVTIAGGTVTATNDTDSDPGIGGGSGGGSGSFRTQGADGARGSAMIFAGSISDRSGEDNWSGIIFPNWGVLLALPHIGTVYGEQTLPAELLIFGGYTLTIPAGASLTVPGGKTLSIRSDATLTNNGTLYCAGDTVINGTLTNNGTIYVDGNLNGTVSGDGVMYYLLTLKDCKVDAANTAEANTSTVNGKTFGKVGGTIYFAATPSANQLVTGWDVTKSVLVQETTDHSGCTISPMPADLVTVKANFATALTVTKPDDKTIDYGQTTNLSVTVSKHSAINERAQVYQWYLDGSSVAATTAPSYTTPADLAAGNHTYTCTITYHANMRSYTVTSAPATVTVNKVASTLTAAPTAKTNLVYNGSAQALVTAGSASGGTMWYSLDGTHWSTDIPTGTDAKTYTVYYKVVGDSNHNDSTPASVSVTIKPRSIAGAAVTLGAALTYNGSGQTQTVTKVTLGGVDITGSCDVSGNVQTNAGSHTLTVTAKSGSNYTGSVTQGFTISKKDITVDITPNGGTYGGAITPASATLLGVLPGESVPVTLTYTGTVNDGTAYNSTDAPTQAGSYTVTASISSANYSLTGTVSAAFAVDKATPTGEPAYTAITTGGKTLADAALKVGTITPDGSIAWDDGADTVVAANTAYGWTYTPADEANYNTLTGTITPYVVSYSGGGIPTYPPTVEQPEEGGSVTTSTGNPTAGDKVTVTPKADEGYEVDEVVVTDKNGNPVEVTDNGDGTYSFTQPSGKVTIRVVFSDAAAIPFVDVPAHAYYYDAVLWAAENGITDGVDETHFAPNATCTRAQIVTFLWRAAGCPEPESLSSFADVPADSYYAKAVAWAVEQGITVGTGDGKFSPDAPCTRAQCVAFLWRAQGTPNANASNPFIDVAEGTFYTDAVLWAAENGITLGTNAEGTTFSPDGDCTRAQIVTFLYRCLGTGAL